MVGQLLHWVYCLPLSEAVALALCGTGVFFLLCRRWEHRRWWKPGLAVLVLCWLAVVLVQTVWIGRVEGRKLSLLPFQCYITVLKGGEKELLRSAFMNVLLFYPGGLLVGRVWKRCPLWLWVAVFLLGSLTIELCQYGFGIGITETDDVIHNTLGGFLGTLAASRYEKHQRRSL